MPEPQQHVIEELFFLNCQRWNTEQCPNLHNGSMQLFISARLAAIDCPEKGQPYGQAAKQFTAAMEVEKTKNVSKPIETQ